MKRVGSFCKFLAYGILTAAAFLSSRTEAAVNKAVVRASIGANQYSKDGGKTWQMVKVGNFFTPGTVIKTVDQGRVDLFLGDNGPVVRVTESTEMEVSKLDIDRTGVESVIDTELNLKSGRLQGNVRKLAAASKYEIETPVGVAAVRGTEYDVSANGTVTCISGTMVVFYRVNSVLDRSTGGTVVNAGQRATPPPTGSNTVTVEQVSQRELQIFPDLKVTVVVVDVTTTPSTEPPVTSGTGTGQSTGGGNNN